MNNTNEHVSGEQTVQAAAAPDTTQMTQTTEQERQVPLVALESERAKRQQMEEENRMMKEHLNLLRAQSAPAPRPQDEFEKMDDSDVLTVGDFKKLSGKLTNQFKMSVDELRMTQKYPDYQSVITQYLPEVLNTNPRLRDTLQNTQDYELAYHLAKTSDSYRKKATQNVRNEDAERIVRNTSQAGSLSSMGASTPVAQAKRYKDMSDSDFKELMHRNLGY